MTNIKFKSIYNKLINLIEIVRKNENITKEYDYSFIKLDTSEKDSKLSLEKLKEKNREYTGSTRLIFKCPMCTYETTINYDSIKINKTKGTIDKEFCIDKNCKYFLKRKNYGLFDVQKMCINYNQTLITKEYENMHQLLSIKCNECKNYREISLINFQSNSACENITCKLYDFDTYNRKGKKKDYDSLLKNQGYEIIFEFEDVETYLFKCKYKHEFKSNLEIFRNILLGRRKSKFCPDCEAISIYDNYMNIINNLNINVILIDYKYGAISFSCKNNHKDKKPLNFFINYNNKRFYICEYCVEEENIVIIKNKLIENQYIFKDIIEDIVIYECKCGNNIKTKYTNILKDKYNCFSCSEQNFTGIITDYLLSIGDIEKTNIISNETFTYQYKDNVYTYTTELLIKKPDCIFVIETKTRTQYENGNNNKMMNILLSKYDFYILYIIENNKRNITKISYTLIGKNKEYNEDNIFHNKKIYQTEYILENYKENDDCNNNEFDFLNRYFSNDGNFYIPADIMDEIRSNDNNIDIVLNKIIELTKNKSFPKKFINKDEIQKSYLSVKNDETEIEENNDEYSIISKTIGIIFLNYFTLDNMLEARNYNKQTLYEMWKNEYKKYELIKKVFETRIGPFDPMKIVQKFAYTGSRVYNFPPNIAKCIYNTFKSNRVLDFCAGYAGRLTGFWASNATEYIGIDPNQDIDYVSIQNELMNIDPKDNKKVKIINKPAEDVDYSELGYFDTIFTSPPYYNTEIYSSNENQSCNKYKTYEEWKNLFLFKIIQKASRCLLDNGCLIINVKNVCVNNKKYNIADDLIYYIETQLLRLKYIDKILLDQSKKNKTHKSEYIYIFKKIKITRLK